MAIWKVPLADVQLGPEEIEAVTKVLKSGWLSMGPAVQEFEEQFAQFLGIKHAFAVANGTAALHLACEVLGLKPGDEVLCPALTFVASANSILYTGATPVFVDITGPHNLNLSVKDAARKITKMTKAVMVVHYGGYPCDMDAINSLARQYGLKIIEDCAHAPGAKYYSQGGPKLVGTLGDVGCFSFFSNKNMTTGEGGMVVTADDEVAEKIKHTRAHGMTSLTWDRHKGHSFSYDVVAKGYNFRIDEMRGALGIIQLRRLVEMNERRRQLTRQYMDRFLDLEDAIEVPFAGFSGESVHHLFPILLKDGDQRTSFMSAMAAQGIQTSIHYPPVTKFSFYKGLFPPGYDHKLPYTLNVAAREVTLPLFPSMTLKQLVEVSEAVKGFFGTVRLIPA
jgi:dTDP-4-amino-4,6-dideoxygalactose transaminase